MDDDMDISQLLAFAESVDILPMEVPVTSDVLEATIDWYQPKSFINSRTNYFSSVIECIPGNESVMFLNSPISPVHKARSSLFGSTEQLVDFDLCGDNSDPRFVCVIDQPGRYAQYKHWCQSGFVNEDGKRMTQKDLASLASSLETDIGVSGSESTMLPLEKLLQQQVNIPVESANVTGGVVDSRIVENTWGDKSFLLGSQLIVSMSCANLTPAIFPRWCLWFNDRLCAWGLADRSTPASNGATGPDCVNADIDFSHNSLDDSCIVEFVSLLEAFVRVRVKTLRLERTGLTNSGLLAFSNLTYLHYVIVEDNRITTSGIVNFLSMQITHKREFYEVLMAQDAPEDTLMDPMYVSLEGNCVAGAPELGNYFEQTDSLLICIADSTGCNPNEPCRILGAQCHAHLVGIGCQRQNPDSS